MARLKQLLWLLMWFSLGCATYWLLLRPGLLVIGDLLIEFMNTPVNLQGGLIFAAGMMAGLIFNYVLRTKHQLNSVEKQLTWMSHDLLEIKRRLRDG